MTTLVQRCQTLEAKIKSLAQAKSLATDLKHIQQRTGEWRARHSKLMSLRTQTAPLTLSSQDAATMASKKGALRQNAQKVLSRLLEKEDIKELTRDAAWTRLLNACEGFTDELDAAGRKAWRAHLEQLGTLENPTTLRLRTPPTPSNARGQSARNRQPSTAGGWRRRPRRDWAWPARRWRRAGGDVRRSGGGWRGNRRRAGAPCRSCRT